MAVKYADRVSTLTTIALNASDTLITVSSTVLFPTGVTSTDYCIATISNQQNTVYETIKITNIFNNELTVERGYGRIADTFSWPTGSIIEIRLNSTLLDELIASAIPRGVITMWSGALNAIPTGWTICDGTNGAPNLTDKFIMGAGNGYEVGDEGGSANATLVTHTHNATSVIANSDHQHFVAATVGAGPNNSPNISSTQTMSYFGYPGGGGFLESYALQGVADVANVGLTSTSNVNNATIETTIVAQGSSAFNANLPPYYALAYIMKL